jgi:hypothetical protein
MNRDDRNAPFDANLRLQLRGLRRDIAPDTDLWPGIAARIDAPPAPAAGTAAAPPLQRVAPWALAASRVLALGVAWRMQPPPAPAAVVPAPDALVVVREARAMTREYDAALRELRVAAAPVASPAAAPALALEELDRSAMQIRSALRDDPDARFLLERLRRTYAARLELTRRLPLG